MIALGRTILEFSPACPVQLLGAIKKRVATHVGSLFKHVLGPQRMLRCYLFVWISGADYSMRRNQKVQMQHSIFVYLPTLRNQK